MSYVKSYKFEFSSQEPSLNNGTELTSYCSLHEIAKLFLDRIYCITTILLINWILIRFSHQLNYESAGFYRVRYTKELRLRLVIPIGDGTLPLLERMNVLNDLIVLVWFRILVLTCNIFGFAYILLKIF